MTNEQKKPRLFPNCLNKNIRNCLPPRNRIPAKKKGKKSHHQVLPVAAST